MAIVVLSAACGRTTASVPADPARPARVALDCEGAAAPVELSRLTEECTDAAMGPCGELSYAAASGVFLVDASLSQSQLLENVELLPTFDPAGRGLVFLRDAARTLVYQDLRSPNQWRTPLSATEESAIVDFYPASGQSGVFRCADDELFDYDESGEETSHELGLWCPGALYSPRDGLLVGQRTTRGYASVKLGVWQARALELAGNCPSLCELTLTRQVLRVQPLVSQLLGDVWTNVPAGPPHYYDAATGAEVGTTALVSPDRGVVAAPGRPIYVAGDLSSAVVEDDSAGAERTLLRYFGPDPKGPERWLTFNVPLSTPRGSLHALPSRDLRRVAVWSDCAVGAGASLLSFSPGEEGVLSYTADCARVHWVNSDGTLLAQVVRSGEPLLDISAAPLALLRPDGRVDSVDIELGRLQGVNEVLSDGRSLVISGRYEGPLYVVDIETAHAREVVPSAGRLLTDDARQRLAFRVGSTRAPSSLWAGAFPH